MGSGASLLLRPDTLSWVPRGKLFHFPHAASSSPINGAGGSAWTSVSEDRQPEEQSGLTLRLLRGGGVVPGLWGEGRGLPATSSSRAIHPCSGPPGQCPPGFNIEANMFLLNHLEGQVGAR